MSKKDNTKIDMINSFIETLPNSRAVFAYGSGVKVQPNNTSKKNQIDLIMVVDNPKRFHEENFKTHPNHYSRSARNFFFKKSEEKQYADTGICYIPYIKFGDDLYKIGIISASKFKDDLTKWQTYYLAGRMQKPITIIKASKSYQEIINKNRHYALIAALILLEPNKEHSLIDLYAMICKLSYIGDTRSKVEDPIIKCRSIVKGSLDEFEKMYGMDNPYFKKKNNDMIEINYENVLKEVSSFPEELVNYLYGKNCDLSDINILRDNIVSFLTMKTSYYSAIQTKKGIKTSGLVKSLKYGLTKLNKGVKSKIKH